MNLKDWFDLSLGVGSFVVGGIVATATFSWFILHNFFVKKVDHNIAISGVKSDVKTITDTLATTQKNIEKIDIFEKNLQSLGQGFEVFKTKYDGDNELRKEQSHNQQKMLEDILHKVNNIASVNQKQLIEMILEERTKK